MTRGSGRGDPFEQNRRIGRGVNVIGYDPLWKRLDGARMQPRHFGLIKEAGFNSVRIPLYPFRFMDEDAGHTISDGWLGALDWAVEQALGNGLTTILDFHEFNAMGRDPHGNKARFLAAWEQLGDRYQDTPDQVVMELLNEPHTELTPELWNEFLIEALAIVRATNPDRTVIVGPGSWNSIQHLSELEVPEDDGNIIVTVHYYNPMAFTHQGAAWAGDHPVGVPWNGTPEEQRAIIDHFEEAQAWSRQYNRPLFLGEFGAYDRADMDSRARWTSFVTRQAEERGWSWAYWQFDSDFILYDIDADRWIEPLRDALIPPQQ